MSGNESLTIPYIDIIVQSGIAIGSVFLGLYAGARLSDRHENKKQQQELEKVRILINADFTLINRQIKNGVKNHKDWQEFINKGEGLAERLPNYDKLIDFLAALRIKLGGFTYWDALTSSGSLIKLNPDELRFVSVTHHTITEMLRLIDSSHDRLANNITKSIFIIQTPIEQKIQTVQKYCADYFKELFDTYDKLDKYVQQVKDNIEWIDLNFEPIKELKKSKTDVPTGNTKNYVPST